MGGKGSGRVAAPAALRLLNGERNGRDSGGRPVVPPPPFDTTPPEAPAWLGDYAAEVWAISIPQLVQLKLTKPEDFATLAAYCEAVEQFRDATLDIRERGLIHESIREGVRIVYPSDPFFMPEKDDERRGYFEPAPMIVRKANPAVAVQHAAMDRIKSLGTQFGFTPASASALSALDKGRGDGNDAGNPFANTA